MSKRKLTNPQWLTPPSSIKPVPALNWIRKWELYQPGEEVPTKAGQNQYNRQRFGIAVWVGTSWDDSTIIVPVGNFPDDLVRQR